MKRHFSLLAALVVLLGMTAPLVADDSPSAAAAAQLRALLEERKLEAIAVRDPEQPGQFVAALYIPGSQLLVISGPYPVPAILDKRIAEAKYMDVYLDLQSAVSHQGQFFVMDLEANGLQRICEKDQPFDSTSKDGANLVAFDGNWDAQQLTEEAYGTRYTEDEARYARMLKLLATVLTRSKTTAP